MTAYVLLIRDQPVRDPAEMAIYGQKVGESPKDPQLTPLVLYGATEALEGAAPDGVVLLQFPTAEAARNWYHSPGYQAAAQHRMKGADYRVMIVEGLG